MPIGVGGTVRLGVSICEDMWDDVLRRQAAARAGGEGRRRCCSTSTRRPSIPASGTSATRIIRAHIARLRKPLVYVNTVGAADNGKNIIPFDGESLVYDARGRLLAIGRQFEEELLVVDVPLGADAPTMPTPDSRCRRSTASARSTTRCVMGLRDYMRKTGFTDAVVPVSGGIDSALALAIAVDALGAGARVAPTTCRRRYNTRDHAVDRRAAGRARSACATA